MENYNPEVLHPLLDNYVKAIEPLAKELIRIDNAYQAGHRFDLSRPDSEIPTEPDYRFGQYNEFEAFSLFGVYISKVKVYRDTDAKDRVVEAHFENFTDTRDNEAPSRIIKIDMQSLSMSSPEIIKYIIDSRRADEAKRKDQEARWHEQQAVIKKEQLEKLIAEFPDLAKEAVKKL